MTTAPHWLGSFETVIFAGQVSTQTGASVAPTIFSGGGIGPTVDPPGRISGVNSNVKLPVCCTPNNIWKLMLAPFANGVASVTTPIDMDELYPPPFG